jgi:hypothetical protein
MFTTNQHASLLQSSKNFILKKKFLQVALGKNLYNPHPNLIFERKVRSPPFEIGPAFCMLTFYLFTNNRLVLNCSAVTNALAYYQFVYILYKVSTTGANLIKHFCNKFTCSFCKLDHFIQMGIIVCNYKMVYFTKSSNFVPKFVPRIGSRCKR